MKAQGKLQMEKVQVSFQFKVWTDSHPLFEGEAPADGQGSDDSNGSGEGADAEECSEESSDSGINCKDPCNNVFI